MNKEELIPGNWYRLDYYGHIYIFKYRKNGDNIATEGNYISNGEIEEASDYFTEDDSCKNMTPADMEEVYKYFPEEKPKQEEFKKGDILYHDTGYNEWIIVYDKHVEGDVKGCENREYIKVNSSGSYHKGDYINTNTKTLRKATPEEEAWLKACAKANKFIPKEEALKPFKIKESMNTYGLNVGDVIPEKVLHAWCKRGKNVFGSSKEWRTGDHFTSNPSRTILKFEQIDGYAAMHLSGCADYFYIKIEGFKEFMDNFDKKQVSYMNKFKIGDKVECVKNPKCYEGAGWEENMEFVIFKITDGLNNNPVAWKDDERSGGVYFSHLELVSEKQELTSLPEKWYIVWKNREIFQATEEYFKDSINKSYNYVENAKVDYQNNYYYAYEKVRHCTEISFEQFKKWVMKEEKPKELTSLPEKWCIKITKENLNVVGTYYNRDGAKCYTGENNVGKYYVSHNMGIGTSVMGKNYGANFSTLTPSNEYKEITFQQFKDWVLKEKTPEYVECIYSNNSNTWTIGKVYKVHADGCIEDNCKDYNSTITWQNRKPDSGFRFKASTKEAFEAQNKPIEPLKTPKTVQKHEFIHGKWYKRVEDPGFTWTKDCLLYVKCDSYQSGGNPLKYSEFINYDGTHKVQNRECSGDNWTEIDQKEVEKYLSKEQPISYKYTVVRCTTQEEWDEVRKAINNVCSPGTFKVEKYDKIPGGIELRNGTHCSISWYENNGPSKILSFKEWKDSLTPINNPISIAEKPKTASVESLKEGEYYTIYNYMSYMGKPEAVMIGLVTLGNNGDNSGRTLRGNATYLSEGTEEFHTDKCWAYKDPDGRNYRFSTPDEIAWLKACIKSGTYIPKPEETLMKNMFVKGDYIVCLDTPEKDSSYPKNYVFKQRENGSYLLSELDATGHRENGWGCINFTKKDISINYDWRYATKEEIAEYDRLGKPYNVTDLIKAPLFISGIDPIETISFPKFAKGDKLQVCKKEEDVKGWGFTYNYGKSFDKINAVQNDIGIVKEVQSIANRWYYRLDCHGSNSYICEDCLSVVSLPIREFTNVEIRGEETPKKQHKFSVGDIIIGNEKADRNYGTTKTGWKGVVTKVEDDFFMAHTEGNPLTTNFTLRYDYFDLVQKDFSSIKWAPELLPDYFYDKDFSKKVKTINPSVNYEKSVETKLVKPKKVVLFQSIFKQNNY